MTPNLVTKRENKKQFLKHPSVLPIPPLVVYSHRAGTGLTEGLNGKYVEKFTLVQGDQNPLSPVQFSCTGPSPSPVQCE